jgi:hypothetical protein
MVDLKKLTKYVWYPMANGWYGKWKVEQIYHNRFVLLSRNYGDNRNKNKFPQVEMRLYDNGSLDILIMDTPNNRKHVKEYNELDKKQTDVIMKAGFY